MYMYYDGLLKIWKIQYMLTKKHLPKVAKNCVAKFL